MMSSLSIRELKYMEALKCGGMRCWWCSNECKAPAFPVITSTDPFRAAGFFCQVPCVKAHLNSRGMKTYPFKVFLKQMCGVPVSACIIPSPPWQRLRYYGAPWGVMSHEQYHDEAWKGCCSSGYDFTIKANLVRAHGDSHISRPMYRRQIRQSNRSIKPRMLPYQPYRITDGVTMSQTEPSDQGELFMQRTNKSSKRSIMTYMTIIKEDNKAEPKSKEISSS